MMPGVSMSSISGFYVRVLERGSISDFDTDSTVGKGCHFSAERLQARNRVK